MELVDGFGVVELGGAEFFDEVVVLDLVGVFEGG